MTFLIITNDVALLVAALFFMAGATHVIGANVMREKYRPRQFAPGFSRVAGTAELLAALFLAVPQTRIWGGILAAMILFVAVVWLLNRGKYLQAIPAVLVMIALAPAVASSML